MNRYRLTSAGRGASPGRRIAPAAAVAVAAAAALLAGCGGGGGSQGGGGSSSPPTLSDVRSTISGVDSIVGTTSEAMAATQYACTGNQSGAGGPTITTTLGGDGVTVIVTVVFPPNFFGPGLVLYGGEIIVTYSPTQHTGSIAFNNFTVNGHTITGTIVLSQLYITSTSVSFVANADLTESGVGSLEGTFTYSDSGGVVSIPSGTFVLTPVNGTAYTVTVTNLLINPSQSGNFIPSSGVISISYPYTLIGGAQLTTTIAIAFNSQSPSSNTAEVAIAGGIQAPVTLP